MSIVYLASSIHFDSIARPRYSLRMFDGNISFSIYSNLTRVCLRQAVMIQLVLFKAVSTILARIERLRTTCIFASGKEAPTRRMYDLGGYSPVGGG